MNPYSYAHKSAVILSEASRSDAQLKDPERSATTACTFLTRTACRAILAASLLAILPITSAHAQGCTQCLDSTRATPPAVQAAYRHAIYLLSGAGLTLFIAGVLFLRREP